MSAEDTTKTLEELITRGEIGQIEKRVCNEVGYIVAQEGRVVLVNQAAMRLIGRRVLVGDDLSSLVGDYASRHHDQWVQEWIASGRNTREMGLRNGPDRSYSIVITGEVWRGDPAELAIIVPLPKAAVHV